MNNKLSNNFKKLIHSRKLKYGSNSVLMIVVVIAIAVLLNVMVGIPDIKWDLSKDKLYSLDDITKNVLKGLNQDVTIIGLFDDVTVSKGTGTYGEVTELLSQYQKNPHIKVQYIDPEKNPSIIKELDPENSYNLQNYDFLIRSKVNGVEKTKVLNAYDLFDVQTDSQTLSEYVAGSNAEQGVTGAIKYVTSEVTPAIYFTEGHNEIKVDDEYKNIKKYLEYNNYSVKTINLLTASEIPSDAQILVFASPKDDLTAKESDMVLNYLKAGGKAIFMFDYTASGTEFTRFNSLLSEYNVAIDNDKVKENDPNMHAQKDEYTILAEAASNSVISQPKYGYVIMQNARSISTLKNAKDYITTTSLVKTTDKAVGESVTKAGEELAGPLDLAVAVENNGFDKASKILVMGSAAFINDNSYQTLGGYGIAFFQQSISWMFDQKDEMIVPTKTYKSNQFTMTQTQSIVSGIVVTIVVPLIILGVGFFVFLRRRHL